MLNFCRFVLCCVALAPVSTLAAAPYSVQPPSEVAVPYSVGGTSPLGVPMPPQVPPYLPNGAINLDYIWTQDGGARLYWNTVLIPQELKMGGATWQDPALVPQLFPPQQPSAVRRPVARRAVAAPVAKAPTNAGSTALRTPARRASTRAASSAKIPPLRASSAAKATAAHVLEDAGPMPEPPRLQ